MTVTLLIAAALIGNTKICMLPDSHHEISTFSEEDGFLENITTY